MKAEGMCGLIRVLESILASAEVCDDIGKKWAEIHGWTDSLASFEFVKAQAYRHVVRRISEELGIEWQKVEEGWRVVEVR